MSRPVDSLDYLLNDFVQRCTPHVQHAIAVSSDGMLVAATGDLPVERADQLSAFAAGLNGLVGGTARVLEAGAVISNVSINAGTSGGIFIGIVQPPDRHRCRRT